jgi:hypothetical protein
MKILDWQKERCALALAEYEWKQFSARRDERLVWTWETLPSGLREIRLKEAAKHLEPIWPILESDDP